MTNYTFEKLSADLERFTTGIQVDLDQVITAIKSQLESWGSEMEIQISAIWERKGYLQMSSAC